MAHSRYVVTRSFDSLYHLRASCPVSDPRRPSRKAAKPKGDPRKQKAQTTSAQPVDRMALLAHQLRTPLSTITTLAQGLMRRASRMSTDDVRERAEKIWRASLRLQELIETIMSYTRLNASGIAIEPSQFGLEALIRRVCRDQSNHEPGRPLNVDLQGLPPAIEGDPVLLEQALVIVLSNAMKYSPPDRPINIRARATDEAITITVEDRGIGVSESDLPFLMQPFFRGQNAKSIPGTGLGLSLAWHILRLHGGSLRIEGREEGGAIVTITLPREHASGFGHGI